MARVTAKGETRTKHTGYEKGKTLQLVRRYIVVHLIDDSKIEIAAFIFNSDIEMFGKLLHKGTVYQISNFRVRMTKPEFLSDCLHSCQMVFNKKTNVVVVQKQCPNILRWENFYTFTPIVDLLGLDDGDTVGRLSALLLD